MAVFDFFFRLEIYVPKAKRRWGYFVLPILHGDRLIGRIDPRFDPKTKVLHINAVHAEEHATRSGDGPAAAKAIRELATWLGATDRGLRRPGAGRLAQSAHRLSEMRLASRRIVRGVSDDEPIEIDGELPGSRRGMPVQESASARPIATACCSWA